MFASELPVPQFIVVDTSGGFWGCTQFTIAVSIPF